MTSVRFSFYGDVQLERTLLRFSDAAADMRPAWERLRRRFVAGQRRQFASEGGWGSGGWDPLSPRYASWKARMYPGKPILRRTDELYNSLTQGPAVNVQEAHMAAFGSDVDYGAHHQRGGERLPQRRPVELPEQERREWMRVIQRYIVTGDV